MFGYLLGEASHVSKVRFLTVDINPRLWLPSISDPPLSTEETLNITSSRNRRYTTADPPS